MKIMPAVQKTFILLIIFLVFVTVIYFIRTKQLKEEYSWIWFLLTLSMLIVIIKLDILIKICNILEIKTPAFLCMFITIIFLLLLCIQYAIVISRHKTDIKNLVQKIALLENKIDETYDNKNTNE